ncbi:MAG: T9SS type A sorting domain-containing protein [Bacteroidales bacterium]|nr:T9SS type A sorting domain-containing protein [Bacteroidales bacterium]
MKIFRYFILMLAVVVCGNVFAQKSQQELNQLMKQRNEYYFTFTLNGSDDLSAIARAISVDCVDGNLVTAYANRKEFADFQKLGYKITLLTPPSMLEKVEMWDGSNRAEYDWDSYPTYEAYEAMMYQFATDHPDKCEIIELGTLPSGRKILIAHINNGDAAGKPKFLYTSTIHGDETTGWILMLRMIDYILENPSLPECQTVLDNIDLFVGPNTNPDGTYHAGNNNVNGATRYNANGVDMNRNYADPHGSPHPDGNAYQQETEWFMQFAEDHSFVMGANYHGGSEVMNYPWDNTYTLHADDAWYQFISHEYADLTHQVSPNYMNDYNNGITNGAQWYMIGGGRQDYMNGYAQCRELTIECSNTKLPNGSQLPNFWNYNKNSIFAFMSQCIYGIHGTVTDATTGQPLEATVTITGHDDQYSIVGSHLPAGDYHRPIKGGTYTLTFTASGYYPHEETITIADYETINLNVQLVAGEGIIPDFTASMTNVALHGSINFTDLTWGANLVSWEWTFEGGEPASSTQQNPTGITYNTIGNYDVTLTVTNADGESETVTKHNYINVTEAYNMQNGTVETCDAMFYDDGGPTANYQDRKDYTMTFLPAATGGMLEAVFEEFAAENGWDFLYIHDGTSTDATQIGEYTGSNSPGTVTATNPDGALTFHFVSDQNTNAAGWIARVHCIGTGHEPLEIEVFADPQTINEGQTSQLSVYAFGGSGNYTYRWEPAEMVVEPEAQITNTIPLTSSEAFTVTVADGEGNTVYATIQVTVIPDVNVIENTMDKVLVYPNPNNGTFTIEAEGETDYQLFNSLGQCILSGVCKGKSQIEVQDLRQGVYFLQFIGKQGTETEKIVIE